MNLMALILCLRECVCTRWDRGKEKEFSGPEVIGIITIFHGRRQVFSEQKKMSPIDSSFQDFHEDDFSIPRGIEVGE
jgi:hypothetical protein